MDTNTNRFSFIVEETIYYLPVTNYQTETTEVDTTEVDSAELRPLSINLTWWQKLLTKCVSFIKNRLGIVDYDISLVPNFTSPFSVSFNNQLVSSSSLLSNMIQQNTSQLSNNEYGEYTNGLTEAEINIVSFRKCNKTANNFCPVCLSEIKINENIIELAVCKHSFHDSCIVKWLKIKGNCPICRKRLL